MIVVLVLTFNYKFHQIQLNCTKIFLELLQIYIQLVERAGVFLNFECCLAYNTPWPRMSVHKKFQPDRSSNIYIYKYYIDTHKQSIKTLKKERRR